MRSRISFFIITLASLFLVVSCGTSGGNGGTASTESTESSQTASTETSIEFNLTLSGIYVGKSDINDLSAQDIATIPNLDTNNAVAMAVSYFSGQLIVTNQNDPGDVRNFPITASVDSDTLVITLMQTIVMVPGTYMFEISLNRAGQEYAGVVVSAITETNGGGINTVNLKLKPVIGDTLISTDIIESLGNLSFRYTDVTLLQDTTSDIIEIGVIIDSTGDEAFFRFNEIGESGAFLNLMSEPNKIELKLYKNGAQVGKSISSQETQVFNFGQDINMDLVPIFGRTLIALSSDGGDATFDVEFPEEIVSLGSGTSDNLKVQLTFNGLLNGTQSQEINGSAFSYDASNDQFGGGQFNFSGVQYDNLSVYLTYRKVDTNDLIGACNFQINLNSTNQHSALCHISVHNSILQSGNLMAMANISVYSPSLTPGASVYAILENGQEESLGITDTNGYIETYLKAGTYQLGARLPGNGRFGSISYQLYPMDVENIVISLDSSAPINASVLINDGSNSTYSKYVTLNMAVQDEDSSVSHYFASELGTVPDSADPNWQTLNDVTSDYQGSKSFQLSESDGVKTVYVWFKNLDQKISQVAQDTIILQKDSGIYSHNFSVTAGTFASTTADLGLLACPGGNSRLADWNDITAYVGSSQTNALEISNLFGLPTDGGTYTGVSNKRLLSYNGNRYQDSGNTRHYYISRLNPDAEIGSGWFTSTLSQLYSWGPSKDITTTHDLVILPETTRDLVVTVPFFGTQTVASINEVQNITARAVCYNDTGYHPLLYGDFEDYTKSIQYWGFSSGTVSIANNQLVLGNEVDQPSSAIQTDIGAIDGATYELSADIKTATNTGDTLLTVRVLDSNDVELASIQTSDNNWNTFTDTLLLDVVGGSHVLPLRVEVSIPAGSDGNAFADNITLIRQ